MAGKGRLLLAADGRCVRAERNGPSLNFVELTEVNGSLYMRKVILTEAANYCSLTVLKIKITCSFMWEVHTASSMYLREFHVQRVDRKGNCAVHLLKTLSLANCINKHQTSQKYI